MTARVLFVCTKNAVRSPMAKALAEDLLKKGQIGAASIDSAGIDPGDIDGFAIATMAEQGLDIQNHEAKDLAEFSNADFDILITLSNAAAIYTREQFSESTDKIENWDVGDPSLTDGNRDQRLAAYRDVRILLTKKIRERFSL